MNNKAKDRFIWVLSGVILALVVLAFLVFRSAGQTGVASNLSSWEKYILNYTSFVRRPGFSARPPEVRGSNSDIGQVFETIWPKGGIRPKPPSALLMTVGSTDIDDTLLGTGAQQVDITCLDINLISFFEIVDMDGTTRVPMSAACFRVQRVHVSVAGAFEDNEGEITIENSGTVYEVIPSGKGGSQSAVYTVPKNRVAVLGDVFFSTSDEIDLEFRFRRPPSGMSRFDIQVNGQIQVLSKGSGCYPSGTDFELVGKKGLGTASIGVTIEFILVDSVTGLCPRSE